MVFAGGVQVLKYRCEGGVIGLGCKGTANKG